LDINIGYHPYHDNVKNMGVFVMADLSARHKERGTSIDETTGGTGVFLGPVLVLYRNNLMFRTSLSFPLYEYVFGTQFSRGTKFNIGLGIAF